MAMGMPSLGFPRLIFGPVDSEEEEEGNLKKRPTTPTMGHYRGTKEPVRGSDLLPDSKDFPAVLLGFDDENFAYIGPTTRKSDDRWDKLNALLDDAIEEAKVVSYNDYKVGMMVIIAVPRGRSEDLYRARILDIPMTPGNKVECLRVDDYFVCNVHPKCIYEIPWSIESLTPLAVRVQIDGLQFFYGLNVFNWKKNERLIFQRGTRSEMFKATKIGVTSYGIDVVKLISHDNKSIVAKVQALVASACKFEMLESDLSYVDYRLLHFTYIDEYYKYIWLHAPKNPVLDRITEVLAPFVPKERTEDQTKDIATYSGMQGALDVFITRYEGVWYRCKITRVMESADGEEDKVYAEYLDFGGYNIVPPSALFPASQIDYNLCLIPPQCLKALVNHDEDQSLEAFFTEMVKGDAKIWVKLAVKTDNETPFLDILIPENFFTDLARKKEPVEISDESGICCSNSNNCYPSTEDIELLAIKEIVDQEIADDPESQRITYEYLDEALSSDSSPTESISTNEYKESSDSYEKQDSPSDDLSSTEGRHCPTQNLIMFDDDDTPLTLIPIGVPRRVRKSVQFAEPLVLSLEAPSHPRTASSSSPRSSTYPDASASASSSSTESSSR